MINWVLIHYDKVEGIYLKKMYRVILAWTTDLKFHALSTLVHILLGVHLQPNGKSHSSDIEWLYQILLKNLKTILLINWKFNTNKVWMGSDVKGIINGFLFSLVSLDQHEHVTLQLENGKEKTTKLKRREKPIESSVLVVLMSQSNWSSVLMSFFPTYDLSLVFLLYIMKHTLSCVIHSKARREKCKSIFQFNSWVRSNFTLKENNPIKRGDSLSSKK